MANIFIPVLFDGNNWCSTVCDFVISILLTSETASIVTTTTGNNPSSPPKSTTQRSSTSTTSISNELYFEMSEWRDGHCEGKGQGDIFMSWH